MSYSHKTFELLIQYQTQDLESTLALKEQIKFHLSIINVESYVEGFCDGLNIDFDHEHKLHELALPEDTPILIYKYDAESLRDIETSLQKTFTSQIQTSIKSFDTKEWLDGWKDSFKPFTTQKFYVRPPWEKAPSTDNLIDLIIEPAMAFGTGQHATTKLCLQQIEAIDHKCKTSRILDLGCGTGILAIAAHKLGGNDIIATDIDPDAILATQANQKLNNCLFDISTGSIPNQKYTLIFVNILAIIIRKLMPQLKDSLEIGGEMILSGILQEEAAEMNAECEKYGFQTLRTTMLEGWACLHVKKVLP